jgi:hypothetical protein
MLLNKSKVLIPYEISINTTYMVPNLFISHSKILGCERNLVPRFGEARNKDGFVILGLWIWGLPPLKKHL